MISTLTMDLTLQGESRQPSQTQIYRVLVVDDECSLRDFITEALRDAEYLVDSAANATEALEKLHKGHFDLLLTDYHMPRKSGLDLIAQMRADGMELPVILMTGRTEELLSEHPDLQVNALLSKPFMLSELMDVAASVLHSVGTAQMHHQPAHRPSRRTVFF